MAIRSSYDGASGAIIESLARVVTPQAKLVAQRSRPFLARLLGNVGTIQSTKFEMHDYPIRANTVTTSTGTQDTTADTSIVLATDHGARLRVGDQVAVVGGQERLLVTAISTDTLTVTRGYGGTTKATIASGATLSVVGNAALEGADYADSGVQAPTVRTNFSQIFTEGFQLSGTMLSLTDITQLMMDVGNGVVNAGTTEYSKQLGIKLEQLMWQLSNTLWNGVAPASTTQGSASVRRTMNGVIEQIREGNAASAGAVYTDLSSADFNSTDALLNLESFLKTIYDAGGHPNELWFGSRIARQLDVYSETTTGPRYMLQDSETIKKKAAGFVCSFGVVNFGLDPSIPADVIVALDSNSVRLVSLPGREFTVFPIARGGDSQKFQIVGEYSLEVLGAAVGSHAVGYGCAA